MTGWVTYGGTGFNAMQSHTHPRRRRISSCSWQPEISNYITFNWSSIDSM